MAKCKFHLCNNETPNNPYRGHTPLFCSTKCKNKYGVNTLRKKRKIEAIEYLGGKCADCGFVGDPACFDFHHQDPTEKEFTISRNITMTMDIIKNELDKCVLLCANCHRVRHTHPD